MPLGPRALRALNRQQHLDDARLCAAYCTQYAWFGVEYGANLLRPLPASSAVLATKQTDCNVACPADKTASAARQPAAEYKSSDPSKVSHDPAVVQSAGNYTYYNCVVDTGNPRALTALARHARCSCRHSPARWSVRGLPVSTTQL